MARSSFPRALAILGASAMFAWQFLQAQHVAEVARERVEVPQVRLGDDAAAGSYPAYSKTEGLSGDLKGVGSSAQEAAVKAWVAGYNEQGPGVTVNYSPDGSGAGRKAEVHTLFAEAADNFKAYGVAGHRHLPEIRQGLQRIARGLPVELTFVPHLTPMIRGIHATLYARLTDPSLDVQALFAERYAGEPFVDVLPAGSHPETRSVRASNLCRIAVHRPQGGDVVVVLSVIDNLVKGAAGQAVQNMNLVLGYPEAMGIEQIALFP